MIDIHSHILPGMDDGSRSVEESFKMIKEAEIAGFDTIIATSHYMEGYYEKERHIREEWVKGLNDGLKRQNINVKILLGNEIYFSENILNLLNEEKAVTLNDSAYVLFETALNAKPINIKDVIYKMLSFKLVPIFAHPERYNYIQKDVSLLYDLKKMGVLFQCNYGSILGRYGEKAKIIMKKMLKANMVQFLGSDCHRENSIYVDVPEALSKINEIIGIAKLDEITSKNPMLVINNKRVEPEESFDIKFSLMEKLALRKNEKNVK